MADEEGKLQLPEVKVIPDWKPRKKKEVDANKSFLKRKPLTVTASGVASVLTALLIKRFLRRRSASQSAKSQLEKGLQIPEHAETDSKRLLEGLTFACSAIFDVEGNTSRYSESKSERVKSAKALRLLFDAGAQLVGRTTTEELNLGLLGDSVEGDNPAAPENSMSGCSCGVALLVASGLADIALGSDHLTGIRIQSSVFGLSAFRPTQDSIQDEGVARVAGSLDQIAWLTNNPSLHPQIAQAFQLPGGSGSFNKYDLVQLVIASEVFDLFGESGAFLRKVALKTAQKWAGSDMTANGFLITYLRKAVPSRSHFMEESNSANEDVLEGIRRAAVTLQYYELLQQHGHLLEDPDSVPPSVLEQLTNAQQVGEEEVEAAERVKEETSLAMRSILKECVIILPSLPSPQPAQGSDIKELRKWEKGTLQLAALTSMTGCPQATLPVQLKDGQPPLGLSLLSLPKSDQRLAQVAAALSVHIDESAQSASIPPSASNHEETNNKKVGNKQNGKPPRASEDESREQERLRQDGNLAFKSGKYREAVEKYSLALKASSDNASLLHSNRAQALIKIGHFQEAEQDCTRALKSGPNAKALLRRGTARASLNNLDGAVQDFKHVLALEPGNRQARTELLSLAQLMDDDADMTGIQGLMGSNLGTNRSNISD